MEKITVNKLSSINPKAKTHSDANLYSWIQIKLVSGLKLKWKKIINLAKLIKNSF